MTTRNTDTDRPTKTTEERHRDIDRRLEALGLTPCEGRFLTYAQAERYLDRLDGSET